MEFDGTKNVKDYIDRDRLLWVRGQFDINGDLQGCGTIIYENSVLYSGIFRRHMRYGIGVEYVVTQRQRNVGLWKGHSLVRLCVPIGEEYLPIQTFTLKCILKHIAHPVAVQLSPLKEFGAEILKSAFDARFEDNSLMCYNYQVIANRMNYKYFECSINAIFQYIFSSYSYKEPSVAQAEEIKDYSIILKFISNILLHVRTEKNRNARENILCKECCQRMSQLLNEQYEIEEEQIISNYSFLENKSEDHFHLSHTSTESCSCSCRCSEDLKSSYSVPTSVSHSNSCSCSCECYEYGTSIHTLHKQEVFYTYLQMYLEQNLLEGVAQPEDVNNSLSFMPHVSNDPLIKDMILYDKEINLEVVENALNRLYHIEPAEHERKCRMFLQCCADGDESLLLELLADSRIDVDVCDCNGNTGFILATVNDRRHIIRLLFTIGGNINYMNDKGLTALSIAMIRTIDPELQFEADVTKHCANLRKQDSVELSRATIHTLINCNANPRICNEPLPVLYLAILTMDPDIVHCVLDSFGNTSDDSLLPFGISAVHLAVCLPFSKESYSILQIIIEHGYDVNALTSADHCTEESLSLLEIEHLYTNGTYQALSKNAAHLLCMRKDFMSSVNDLTESTSENVSVIQCNMANELIKFNCNYNHLYAGHTPLSLAIIRGNHKLVDCLTQTSKVDCHQVLGANMGNAFTVLAMVKFSSTVPLDVCRDIFSIMITNGANIFNIIGNHYENSIHFMEEYLHNLKTVTDKENKGLKVKSKAFKKKLRPKKNNLKNTSDRQPTLFNSPEEIYKIILMFANESLNQFISTKVASLLIHCLSVNLYDPLFKKWKQYLTLHSFNKALALKLYKTDPTVDILPEFLRLIGLEDIQIENKFSAQELEKTASLKKSASIFEYSSENHDSRYDVCFTCYRTADRNLKLCPCCEIAKFCSANCLKKANTHICNEQPPFEAWGCITNKISVIKQISRILWIEQRLQTKIHELEALFLESKYQPFSINTRLQDLRCKLVRAEEKHISFKRQLVKSKVLKGCFEICSVET